MNKLPVVRVYSKPGCGPCIATKRAFESHGVPFVEEDATDEMNRAAFEELGFKSAPVVTVGESADDMWTGFKPDRIAAIAARFKAVRG